MKNRYCFTTLSIIQTLARMRIGGQACVKSHVSQHGAVKSSKAESRDVFFVVVVLVVDGGIGVFGEEVVRYCCISSTQREPITL